MCTALDEKLFATENSTCSAVDSKLVEANNKFNTLVDEKMKAAKQDFLRAMPTPTIGPNGGLKCFFT